MRYNVAQLLKGQIGTQRNHDIDERINNLDLGLEPVQPLTGKVTLMRTSQGILATGILRTAVQTECNRCLEPCLAEVKIELEEEFHPLVPIEGAHIDAVPEEERDEALLIDEHQILDLGEAIRQNLWLALPEHILCKADCQGICPECGGNRNLGECQCGDTAIDPRWAALQTLLVEETDSNERRD